MTQDDKWLLLQDAHGSLSAAFAAMDLESRGSDPEKLQLKSGYDELQLIKTFNMTRLATNDGGIEIMNLLHSNW